MCCPTHTRTQLLFVESIGLPTENVKIKNTSNVALRVPGGGIAMPKKSATGATRAVPVNMRLVTKQGTRTTDEFKQDLILIVRQLNNKLTGLKLRKEKLDLDNRTRRQQITALQLAPPLEA